MVHSSDRPDAYWWMDGLGVVVAGGGFCGIIVLVWGESLHHSDNWSGVDRLVTPGHIVPEWYFLPYYAALRASSSKRGGVLLLVGGSCLLVCVVSGGASPWGHAAVGGCSEVAGISSGMLVLGGLGAALPVYPFVELSAALAGGVCVALG